MKSLQLIGLIVGIILIIAVAGCLSTDGNNSSASETPTALETPVPTSVPDDNITINEANVTLLPEDDTTIIANATLVNNVSQT